MVVEDIRAQRPTNNAILWVATGTSPRLLAGLFYSIASVIWTGGLSSVDRERFAYVVAHDSLACADVTARFPRACHELERARSGSTSASLFSSFSRFSTSVQYTAGPNSRPHRPTRPRTLALGPLML